MERVRLWNRLVFSTEWMDKVYRSSKHDEHMGAKQRVNGSKDQASGFVRKDIKRLLNQICMRLYQKGIRDEIVVRGYKEYICKQDESDDSEKD